MSTLLEARMRSLKDKVFGVNRTEREEVAEKPKKTKTVKRSKVKKTVSKKK